MEKSFVFGFLTTATLVSVSHAALLLGVTDTNNPVSFDSAIPSGSIVNLTANVSGAPGFVEFWGIDDNANVYSIALSGMATLLSSSFSPSGFNVGLSTEPFLRTLCLVRRCRNA